MLSRFDWFCITKGDLMHPHVTSRRHGSFLVLREDCHAWCTQSAQKFLYFFRVPTRVAKWLGNDRFGRRQCRFSLFMFQRLSSDRAGIFKNTRCDIDCIFRITKGEPKKFCLAGIINTAPHRAKQSGSIQQRWDLLKCVETKVCQDKRKVSQLKN